MIKKSKSALGEKEGINNPNQKQKRCDTRELNPLHSLGKRRC